MSERTADFFDRYASDFSAMYGSRKTLPNLVIDSFFRRSMRLRFNLTLEGCNPIVGKCVLDVGCGPGHYSVEFARRDAAAVVGIDIAPAMIELSKHNSLQSGVAAKCEFSLVDFSTYRTNCKFDYIVAMGLMDYVKEPATVLHKAMSLCTDRCFFSFPVEGGLLAWQRKLRYRARCELYMYTRQQLEELFAPLGFSRIDVRRIARDFFVTAWIR